MSIDNKVDLAVTAPLGAGTMTYQWGQSSKTTAKKDVDNRRTYVQPTLSHIGIQDERYVLAVSAFQRIITPSGDGAYGQDPELVAPSQREYSGMQ